MGATQLIGHIDIALGMREAGASQRDIATQLGISQAVVSKLLRKFTMTTFKTRGPRRVYKRSTTDRHNRRVVRLAMKLKSITLQDLTNRLDLGVSKKTIASHLKEVGIRKRIARTKPHLTSEHMSARLAWAKEHESWTFE
jgi:predicted transcriptional regulator